MISARNTLKNWFKRSLKPLEVQFASWLDSFYHKEEDEIPMNAIDGLEAALGNFALNENVAALIDALRNELRGSNSYFSGQAFATWSGTGLVFDVVWPTYYIQGVEYPAGTGQVTLVPADVTNPRLDVIAVDATGAIRITGTANADPAKPTVDVLTQLEITTVLVAAGATTPTEVTDEAVYKENLEWVGSSDNGTVDFDATAFAFEGSKHVDCGAFTNGQHVKFNNGSPLSIADYSVLRFYVSLKASFSTTAGFILKFYNGGTLVSSAVTITHNLYNFNRTVVGSYQLITIPISAFSFSNAAFDTVYIQLKATNASGFRLDNIVLQTGGSGVSPLQNTIGSIVTDDGVLNIDSPNKLVSFKGAKLTAPNEITFGKQYLKGYFATLAALEAAHPTGEEGDYAYVDTGIGDNVQVFIWDSSDAQWVLSSSNNTIEWIPLALGDRATNYAIPFDVRRYITVNFTAEVTLSVDTADAKLLMPVVMKATGTQPILTSDFKLVSGAWSNALANYIRMQRVSDTEIHYEIYQL
jgi:hypothetical protein